MHFLPGCAAEVHCQHSLAGLQAMCMSCELWPASKTIPSTKIVQSAHAQCTLQDHAGAVHAPANIGIAKGTWGLQGVMPAAILNLSAARLMAAGVLADHMHAALKRASGIACCTCKQGVEMWDGGHPEYPLCLQVKCMKA